MSHLWLSGRGSCPGNVRPDVYAAAQTGRRKKSHHRYPDMTSSVSERNRKCVSDLGFEQAAVGRVGRAASLPLLALCLDFWRKNKRVTDEHRRPQQMALRPGTSVSSPSRCSVVTRPRATMKAIFCGEKDVSEEDKDCRPVLLVHVFKI